MNNLIQIQSRINVCPDRSRLKKKKKPFEEQTIIAEVSNDLIYYYNSFIYKKYGIQLEPPGFGAHITINNGVTPIKNRYSNPIVQYLTTINNKHINVLIDPENMYLFEYKKYICIPVYSVYFNNIRNRLGLTPKAFFHITLGKIKDGDLTHTKDISNTDFNNSVNNSNYKEKQSGVIHVSEKSKCVRKLII